MTDTGERSAERNARPDAGAVMGGDMTATDAIRQAKRELDEETKREKVEEAKNILRQIEMLKAQLAALQRQIKEL